MRLDPRFLVVDGYVIGMMRERNASKIPFKLGARGCRDQAIGDRNGNGNLMGMAELLLKHSYLFLTEFHLRQAH